MMSVVCDKILNTNVLVHTRKRWRETEMRMMSNENTIPITLCLLPLIAFLESSLCVTQR